MRIIDETPEERLAQDISALNDSVSTINALMQEARLQEIDSRIEANYKHLEIMLAKLDSHLTSAQKTTYSNCINTAKEFLNIS